MTNAGDPSPGDPPALPDPDELPEPPDPIPFLETAVETPSDESVEEMRSLLVETIESLSAATGAGEVSIEVDGAGNTIATKAARDPAGGRHVVLNTHIDTVSPHVPYERTEGTIRGRGSCDAKGPLAAMVAAFAAVDPDRGRVTLAVTPDEETLSTGAAALTGRMDVPEVTPIDGDWYVVGEPTGLDVCTAAKGRFQGTIQLRGESAHAAEVDAGANAIAAAEPVLAAIGEFDRDAEPHPQLGPPLLTPTTIDGGEATNQVPADCSITIDRRSVPPETAEGFRDRLRADLEAAVPGGIEATFQFTDRPSPFLEAFDTDPSHELVRTLATAAGEVGTGPEGGAVRPFGAATEASYFSPAPTVVFGPGELSDEEGPVAHSDREYVRVAEARDAAEVLTATLTVATGH